jgi:imidazoleglycerol phosphate dehydratase HisB
MTMAKTSREDFEALVRRAGVTLSQEQITQIHTGWGFVEPMLERIRTHGRDRPAEPAHVFRPDIYGTEI